MTLTFELDLDILPFDLHAKIQVCTSVRSAVSARQTHTHTLTDDAKTITPVADTGCKYSASKFHCSPEFSDVLDLQ